MGVGLPSGRPVLILEHSTPHQNPSANIAQKTSLIAAFQPEINHFQLLLRSVERHNSRHLLSATATPSRQVMYATYFCWRRHKGDKPFWATAKRLIQIMNSTWSVQSIIAATDSLRNINCFCLSVIFVQNPLNGRGWRQRREVPSKTCSSSMAMARNRSILPFPTLLSAIKSYSCPV
jgi:hypothetical protein